ncbi:hypothetical protein AYO38_05030 [bacterium SCGC AG-212-C10]|nr:hypothetical protein AYO38_05030 [bacterium SCGC AG-212-C10]
MMMMGIVALGLIGAAYTLWYEDLQLNATITTGTFNADWSIYDICGGADSTAETPANASDAASPCINSAATDDEGVPVVALPTNNPNPIGAGAILPSAVISAQGTGYAAYTNGQYILNGVTKPTTSCDETRTSGGAPLAANDNVLDNNVLNLAVGGAFPYAGCMFRFDLHSSGTVPLHIAIMSATVSCAGAGCGPGPYNQFEIINDSTFVNGSNPNPSKCQGLVNAINAVIAGGSAATVTFLGDNPNATPTPLQIHSNADVVCNIKIILKETAAENVTYSLAVVFRAHQWNETIAP